MTASGGVESSILLEWFTICISHIEYHWVQCWKRLRNLSVFLVISIVTVDVPSSCQSGKFPNLTVNL